jgi:hypothetical protein
MYVAGPLIEQRAPASPTRNAGIYRIGIDDRSLSMPLKKHSR